MNSGLILEGVTKEELFVQFSNIVGRLVRLEEKVNNNVRSEYTLSELSKIKGYSKVQLRRIIAKKDIPYKIEGKELVITRENSSRLKSKL